MPLQILVVCSESRAYKLLFLARKIYVAVKFLIDEAWEKLKLGYKILVCRKLLVDH